MNSGLVSDPNLLRMRREELLPSSSPLSFPKKPQIHHSAWPPQVADHLVPNQILGFFEFQGERERGKLSVFKGLKKPLSAQIQEN